MTELTNMRMNDQDGYSHVVIITLSVAALVFGPVTKGSVRLEDKSR